MAKKKLADGLHVFKDPKWEGDWRCELWVGQQQIATYGKTAALAAVGQMVLALTLGPGSQETAMGLLGSAAEKLMNDQFFKAIMSSVKNSKKDSG